MSADADFSKFNKKNDEQMFVNVKRFLTFNFLFKTNNEEFLKRIYDNNSNVFIIVFIFN